MEKEYNVSNVVMDKTIDKRNENATENEKITKELQTKAAEIGFRFVIDQEMPTVRRMWVADNNPNSDTTFKFAKLDNDNNVISWDGKEIEAFENYYENAKSLLKTPENTKLYKAKVCSDIQYVGIDGEDYSEEDEVYEEKFETPQEALEFIRETAKDECLCGRYITASLDGKTVVYGISVEDNDEAYSNIDACVNNFYTRNNIPKVKIIRETKEVSNSIEDTQTNTLGKDQINWKTPVKTYQNKFLYEKEADIPYGIRNRQQWCCWRSEWYPSGKIELDENGNKVLLMLKDENGNLITDEDGNPVPDGKWIKIPYSPNVSRAGVPYRAKSNDPKTWGTYEDCCKAIRKYGLDGLGIMLGKGVMGIDIDHIRNEKGELNELTKNIISIAETYTEYSPSRTGVHLLMFGHLPDEFNGKGRKVLLDENTKEAIEFYGDKRFFTFTGDVVEGITRRMASSAEGTLRVNQIVEDFIPLEKRNRATGQKVEITWDENDEELRIIQDNAELVQKMIAAGERDKNKKTIWRGGKEIKNEYYGINVPYELYSGDFEKITSDHSLADYMLVGKIWYYTDSPKQVDEIMRESKLMRDKWDRPQNFSTYGKETINNYINDNPTTNKYNPNWWKQKLEEQKQQRQQQKAQRQMDKEAAKAAKADAKGMEM